MAATVRLSAAAYYGADGLIGSSELCLDFILTPANLIYRSLGVMTVPVGQQLAPGDMVTATGTKATAAGSIAGISACWMNTMAGNGPRDALILVRDAEVRDAELHYGEMAAGAVDDQLKTLGIIVRAATLPSAVQFGFGTPGQPLTTVAGAIEAAAAAGAPIPFVGVKDEDPQAGPPVRREGDQRNPEAGGRE